MALGLSCRWVHGGWLAGRYEGEWRDNVPHGHGIEYTPTGAVKYEGQWKEGSRVGRSGVASAVAALVSPRSPSLVTKHVVSRKREGLMDGWATELCLTADLTRFTVQAQASKGSGHLSLSRPGKAQPTTAASSSPFLSFTTLLLALVMVLLAAAVAGVLYLRQSEYGEEGFTLPEGFVLPWPQAWQ